MKRTHPQPLSKGEIRLNVRVKNICLALVLSVSMFSCSVNNLTTENISATNISDLTTRQS